MAGATVIESPVWTPIGSRFSMEQTTTKLSARSRITSNSYSFQPSSDSSTSTEPTGLCFRPNSTFCDKVVAVVGGARAGAAQGKGGADQEREAADLLRDGQRLLQRVGEPAARHLQPGLQHGIFEEEAILGQLHGRRARRR